MTAILDAVQNIASIQGWSMTFGMILSFAAQLLLSRYLAAFGNLV
jgi:hypothetical protein